MANPTVLKRELHLQFTDANKETVTIVVAYPKDEVTKTELDTLGQLLVEKDVIRSKKDGILTSFDHGEIVTTQSVVVE